MVELLSSPEKEMYVMELKCKIMTKGDFYPQLTHFIPQK